MRIAFFVELETWRVERVEFDDSSRKAFYKTVRAKELSGFPDATGTFQWTPAVRALALLFLRQFLFSQGKLPGPESGLRGGAGSQAASLDYALSKQPTWMCEMFGSNSSGKAIARSIITRINPERKRGGDVVLRINQHILRNSSISFHSADQSIVEDADLLSLENAWSSQPTDGVRRMRPAAPPQQFSLTQSSSLLSQQFAQRDQFNLQEDVAHEVLYMLRSTDIFRRESYQESFQKLCGIIRRDASGSNVQELLPNIDQKITEAGFLGLRQFPERSHIIRHAEQIRIATGAAAFASIALLKHTASRYGCAIEIDHEHINTRTLIREIGDWQGRKQPPDGVVVSVSCAAMFLRSRRCHDYAPLMVLPGNSHRIVRSRELAKTRRPSCEWTFISDEPTTSSFYLDDIFSDSTSITYSKRLADQHELLNSGSLTREDFQAVLWYPHYRFQELFNGHETSVLPSQRWHYTGNVLFLRTDRFEQLGLALNTAIRDSWLDLLANPRLIGTLCMGMINCDKYIQSLYRTSGLFFYPELTSESLRAPLQARYQWLQ